ncbi:TetR/AcrR family transcriptional regulator [Clostridium akagii]|uniref:TetR/AcrR family transcriptional regulator n=1 Tax=Clostridium akagii TaxID=91623 RepID=UPI00047B6DAE|nr:TetR/AcrR family transcriptional regulator [Clostridium akagii]
MQYLKEEVRDKILSIALGEFKKNGYLAASMRNIASGSDIALGSIYRYFTNKQALFETLIDPVYSKIFTYLSKIQEQINESVLSNNCAPMPYVNDIVNELVEIIMESDAEIMIIFNKSKGSKYENVKEELVNLINDINVQSYPKSIARDENNRTMIYVVSYTLVEGISLILKEDYDVDRIKLLINKLIYISFKDLHIRLDGLKSEDNN